jgi:hypothetical protein
MGYGFTLDRGVALAGTASVYILWKDQLSQVGFAL